MKPLYTKFEFKSAKSLDKLPCKCYNCNNIFYVTKKYIGNVLRKNHVKKAKFCSKKCTNYRKNKQTVNCTNCNKAFQKLPSQIKKSKSGNHFCSKSCAVSYNNKHKTTGTGRSKLEKCLEQQLTNLYPNLEIHFNRKDTINSELDIYIPSLKLAFDLNGIFHYEPIYGNDKLQKIQENDSNKFQKCQENNISLCVIDTSSQKYFKEKSSKKYLNIITTIINNKSFL